MKKQYLFLLLAGFALAGCKNVVNTDKAYDPNGYNMKELEAENITVSFYYNFGKEENERVEQFIEDAYKTRKKK